jgi:hypothetical protein
VALGATWFLWEEQEEEQEVDLGAGPFWFTPRPRRHRLHAGGGLRDGVSDSHVMIHDSDVCGLAHVWQISIVGACGM